jgi:hypothetical protein
MAPVALLVAVEAAVVLVVALAVSVVRVVLSMVVAPLPVVSLVDDAVVGRSAAPPRTIASLDELRRITHAPVWSSLVHTDAPTLRLERATDAELSEWQRRLDRHLYACGCTSGAITLLAAIAALAAIQFVADVEFGSRLRTAGVWVAVAFAAALVGKTAGLAAAQVNRRRLYSEIERTLADRRDLSIHH